MGGAAFGGAKSVAKSRAVGGAAFGGAGGGSLGGGKKVGAGIDGGAGTPSGRSLRTGLRADFSSEWLIYMCVRDSEASLRTFDNLGSPLFQQSTFPSVAGFVFAIHCSPLLPL